jgi:hypothetical protein
MGFRSVKVRAGSTTVQVTTIIDRTGHKGLGRMVAVALGRAVVTRQQSTDGPSITVLVARDAARMLSGSLETRPAP